MDKNQKAKEALTIVFGVAKRDGLVSGIPTRVPGLREVLTCYDCEVKLDKGLPKQFSPFMSEKQKADFKQLMKGK